MAYNPPIGSIYHLYTTYILPSGGLYATYHLLREPETTIEMLLCYLYKRDTFIRETPTHGYTSPYQLTVTKNFVRYLKWRDPRLM